MPTSKLHDINLTTLIEIISKQNQTNAAAATKDKKKQMQFYPYNKSILTRVIHKQLKVSNVMVLNHYSKIAIEKHLRLPQNSGYQSGPAKGLFNTLIKLGYCQQNVLSDFNRITKFKITQQ